MTRDEVHAGVQEVLRRTFRAPDLVVDDATRSVDVDGWDSLAHATVLVRLEKKFDVRIPDEVAYDLANVGELIDAVHQQISG